MGMGWSYRLGKLKGIEQADLHAIEKHVLKADEQCSTPSNPDSMDVPCKLCPRCLSEIVEPRQQTDDWHPLGGRQLHWRLCPRRVGVSMDSHGRRSERDAVVGITSDSSKPKDAPKQRGVARTAKPVGSGNLQCQFFIGIEEDEKFGVVRRILGTHGANMKYIVAQTGSRLRLRGRGSGFLEGASQLESKDQLMLCVSAPIASYQVTKELVISLLGTIYQQFRDHCIREGIAAPKVGIQLHEGYRPGGR